MFKKIKFIPIILLTLILLSACGKHGEEPLQSSTPSEISSEPYITFTNESGEKLYLGMGNEECGKILGYEIKDGWLTMIHMSTTIEHSVLSIISSDGLIRLISSSTPEWTMASGLGVGSEKDEAMKVFGELKQAGKRTLTYKLEDGYNIDFIVGSDGKLISVGASWPIAGDAENPYGATFGIRQLIGWGTGDAHVEGVISPREYLDISHEGLGEFKVTLNETYISNNKEYKDQFVIIDRTGPYKGRVFNPSKYVASIDVVASGKWAIWADLYLLEAIVTQESSFKGTGDYATLYISPDTGGITGIWKVTHEGDGKYILKTNSFYTDDANAKTIFLECDGPYSGEIEIENPKHASGNIIPVAFEIITDGSWALERVG